MNAKNKNYLSLIIWIAALIVIGGTIGFLIKPEINIWYKILHRSILTPPNYIFPVAWTILYGIIGTCGWIIWYKCSFSKRLSVIKILYITQLILNWSWTPLFFHYHLIAFSLIVLGVMDILSFIIICLTYRKMRIISLLMIPYLFWILFATYLNFYVWKYN